MTRKPVLFLVALLILPKAVIGAVTDSADGGFSMKHSITVQCSPEKAYATFINVGTWWSPAHTWSGDATNMVIEAKPSGAFIEKLPDEGFARHMDVVYVAPGKMIRLQGGLGPLQEYAVQGSMTVNFEGKDDSTLVTVTYNVGGYVNGGLKNWATPVDQVVCEQFNRLKKRIDGTLTETP